MSTGSPLGARHGTAGMVVLVIAIAAVAVTVTTAVAISIVIGRPVAAASVIMAAAGLVGMLNRSLRAVEGGDPRADG